MDEENYRNAYRELNTTPCVYQKALLSKRCECRHGHFFQLAEREAVACEFPEARAQCAALYDLVADKARFALHKKDDEPLTHAQAMKVQLGGVTGLQQLLGDEQPTPEMGRLILKLNMRYPDLMGLPVDEIVRAIVHYQVRRRRVD